MNNSVLSLDLKEPIWCRQF